MKSEPGRVQDKPIGGYRLALLESYKAAIRAQLADDPSPWLRIRRRSLSGCCLG